MRRIIILLCITALVVSCGSKPKKSPDFLFGSKLYSKYVDYYLKGEARLARWLSLLRRISFLRWMPCAI